MRKKFALLTFIISSYSGLAENVCTLYGNCWDFVIECPTAIKSISYIAFDGSIFQDSNIHIANSDVFVGINVKGPYVLGQISYSEPSHLYIDLGTSEPDRFLLDSTSHNISLLNLKRTSARLF